MKKFLSTWAKSKIFCASTLTDALCAISASGGLMACVVGEDGTLVGILTDSDIRRAIIKGASLEDRAEKWMQRNPVVGYSTAEADELLSTAEVNGIREIPLLDNNGKLDDIFVALTHQERIFSPEGNVTDFRKKSSFSDRKAFPMLIQAGGLGTRLRSVVSDRPKPLALVGGRPILETLIFHAANFGISEFYVSVNYMAESIIDHLKHDRYKDFKIHILREETRLGTAGSISLIPHEIKSPLIMANADILTTLSFEQLQEFHLNEKAEITCAVRPYQTIVPYGVVQIDENSIIGLSEKPKLTHFVNTGIYILSPEVCQMVPPDEFLDMPTLIDRCIQDKLTVKAFLQHEYWADIGRPEDFHQANQDYFKHFGINNEF